MSDLQKEAVSKANTRFTPELALSLTEDICSQLIYGGKLQQILDSDKEKYPSNFTFYKWLDKNAEIAKMYARTREIIQDNAIEDIVTIADTEEDASKARNMIDVRKWRAARISPKKYGDKVETTNVNLNASVDSEMSSDQLKRLAELTLERLG